MIYALVCPIEYDVNYTVRDTFLVPKRIRHLLSLRNGPRVRASSDGRTLLNALLLTSLPGDERTALSYLLFSVNRSHLQFLCLTEGLRASHQPVLSICAVAPNDIHISDVVGHC
jgi:hypothetical protein